jgi:hypothetical protein
MFDHASDDYETIIGYLSDYFRLSVPSGTVYFRGGVCDIRYVKGVND